ncbi:HlyD family type I secretion periplasmic adaptor subunit [Ramlibacter albus]|uniref:Membrane fusion protein (MFP) family protein n=1 Tax=Ramlibacter albus TaxID=2079448 RepID=A0A923M6H7_9BURK|nr:HlyD family type I secretion periplasmic adaptor subunit [Ramlibacter albus]MBC5764733.1 HlyD family type I secretion periplasmic adaptor subunit [Ramlibacter albus]
MATNENTTDLKEALVQGMGPDAGDDAARLLAGDRSRANRIALYALGIFFGGFLLWAAFAPLDEGVPSMGNVAIDTKRKAVQHQTGGIVKEVHVREGDVVKEGQLLMRLDSAVAKANFEATRQRYLGLRAIQARLLAEQSGADKITFHPDLVAASTDPLIKGQVMTQEQLFQSRRAALRADLQGIQESIQGQEALVQAYQSMLASRKSQMGLLNEELNNTRGLVKEGYAPRNRQLELERSQAEMNSAQAELLGNITRAQRAIAELRQRSIQRQQEYRKEVETQLTDVARDVTSEEGKYVALQQDLERIDIKSPAAGQVVGLGAQTVGGVVQPGQKLMDIVPTDEPLVLETRVAPHMIDRVHEGMPVDVRFSAFAHSPQLVVQGKLISISKDLITEQQTGQSFYLARATVTPEGMKKLGKRRMQPGMPVEVVFTTGERSLLTYLLNPLTKRVAAAMKEE